MSNKIFYTVALVLNILAFLLLHENSTARLMDAPLGILLVLVLLLIIAMFIYTFYITFWRTHLFRPRILWPLSLGLFYILIYVGIFYFVQIVYETTMLRHPFWFFVPLTAVSIVHHFWAEKHPDFTRSNFVSLIVLFILGVITTGLLLLISSDFVF